MQGHRCWGIVPTNWFSLRLLNRSLQTADGRIERDVICEFNKREILNNDLNHWRLGKSKKNIGVG